MTSGGPMDCRRNRPPVRAEVPTTSTQSPTAVLRSSTTRAVLQDLFSLGGHLPRVAIVAIRLGGHQHQVAQAEIAHHPRRRPEVARDLRTHQHDSAKFEGRGRHELRPVELKRLSQGLVHTAAAGRRPGNWLPGPGPRSSRPRGTSGPWAEDFPRQAESARLRSDRCYRAEWDDRRPHR